MLVAQLPTVCHGFMTACQCQQELDPAVDREPAAELSELAQPFTDAPAAAAEAGAATEETWRAAWDALLVLLHDKVSSIACHACVLLT